MCGRYALYSSPKLIQEVFSLNEIIPFEPSYNIAPTQFVPVVCELPDHQRRLIPMRWGLIPSWQKEKKISSPMINARIETIDSKPAFRKAILSRRCLIIADGYYEWVAGALSKQPYFIRMKNQQPFGMAGIWERWVGEDETIDSCSIITTNADDNIKHLHERMPLIIDSRQYDKWLDINNERWDEVKNVLGFREEYLEFYSVSKKVNNARYNGSDCVEFLELN